MPQLNAQQQMAVQLRGTNILVSAAAGSGKTFVLTQRVAQMLMDPENPVDADRFLISTFTRSAAAQMKKKIRDRLEEQSAQNPRQAARQRVLLELAQIGTIDSFCLTLVREYGAEAGIPPTVSVSEESLVRQHEAAAVREVLSRYYTQADPAFERLAELYFAGATRDPITDDILDCMDCCQSFPDPKGWLQRAAELYDQTPEAQNFWQQRALCYAQKQLAHISGRLFAMRDAAQAANNAAWCAKITGYEEQFVILTEAAERGLEELKNELAVFKMANAAEKRTPEGAFLSAVKTDISNDVKELIALLFIDAAELEAQRQELRALCGMFAQVVCDCLDEARARKQSAGVYGFSDISRAAYDLLIKHDTDGTPHRTPLAQQLSTRYDEIMIDEFQDVNQLQFGIFSALSNGKNLYMVGDVKQSIYRFRGSRPEIFDNVAADYAAHPEHGTLLQLNYNYRSHPAVLEAANFIFTLMMHRQTAEIEYDDLQRLNCGLPEKYEGVQNGGFEFELISKGELSAAETEARFIASRIEQLLQQEMMLDKVSRKVRLSDICIMARKNSVLKDLHTQLSQMGIPCSFVKSGNLFETPEVAALLALLRAVNHPSDDVAMLAALMSPVWNFDPDDMAVISCGRQKLSVYARLLAAREDAAHPAVAQKCIRVAEELACLQNCSVMMNLPELIDAALSVTDFAANAAAFGDGTGQSASRCRENLAAFSEYASGLDDGSGSLPDFLEAVDLAISREKYPLSKPAHDEDSVALMTVHGSKGLEFPICFLAGCHCDLWRGGGLREGKWKFDAESFALRLITPDGNGVYTPWHMQMISKQTAAKERAEELRLLYVALTRAKHLMIATAVQEECENYVCKVAQQTGGGVFDTAALGAKRYSDWITVAALSHPDGGELRALTGLQIPVVENAREWRVGIRREFEQPSAPQAAEAVTADAELTRQLCQRLAFIYDGEELCYTPQKYTVTQLAKQGSTELEKPAFISAKRGTRYGTMLHEFLQLCDFSRAAEGAQILADELRREGKLSSEAELSLNFAAVERFFASQVFAEPMKAKTVYKEYNFLSEIPIGYTNPDIDPDFADVKVLLQGCADCIGVYEDHLLLIDYKSDRVQTPDQLTERYALQLQLYARCLQEQFGLPVTRRIIYSFALGQGIEVPSEQEPAHQPV